LHRNRFVLTNIRIDRNFFFVSILFGNLEDLMSVLNSNIFISNNDRDNLLKHFFTNAVIDSNKENILDITKSRAIHKDRYIATSFVYVAETGNHRLIKIGTTKNPSNRLGYSKEYFKVSLGYIAIFSGDLLLESFLLKQFSEFKVDLVNGKKSREWFSNTGRLNLFVKELKNSRKVTIHAINDR
jgi:hypothetical protein